MIEYTRLGSLLLNGKFGSDQIIIASNSTAIIPTIRNAARLFADEHGETHFEDIEFPMQDVQYAPPAPALQLSDPIAATRLSWLRFPADWNDAAHPSPRRQLFVVLTGEIEGWTSKGDRRHFRPGDCLLMEDTVGKGHGAKPLDGEALAIMVALE